MNLTRPLNYFFRKSPVIRWLFIVAVVAAAITIAVLLSIRSKPMPEILNINPSIGAPGDLVIINGKDFGEIKDTSFVEFGGRKLTSSSILSWKNTEIKLILPANVQDGLVYVGNKDSKSNAKFFANVTAVPVEIAENPVNVMPVITDMICDKFAPGHMLTIKGVNFGNSREKSQVLFACLREEPSAKDDKLVKSKENSLFSFSADDYLEYEYWSDSEIHVRIPDGASSGNIVVKTDKGNSPSKKLVLEGKTGYKKFVSPKTYVVKVSVDIEDSSNDKSSTIILRCPRPVMSVFQPYISMTEYSPEPVIFDFQNTVIHQTSLEKSYSNRKKFYQNFAVTAYEIDTKIYSSNITGYSKETLSSLDYALTDDALIDCSDESVKKLVSKIIGKETNPYLKAKLIYDYMLKNFTVLKDLRTGKISPLDLLRLKRGDAYDFAVCLTALLRAAKVPAITDSGIIISPDLKARNHWWCEFYLEDFGWVPCDVALACGLEYQKWTKDIDPESFYFGNLDAQHVTFSRGWNEIKAGYANNKTVQRQRSYALQSIWEEASGNVVKYSSYWADPVVIGVY